MNLTSSAAARWSVSARATGEVLTATVPGTDLQLVLLGVPRSFTSEEVQGWLADLAGVARETSRSDGRTRAIPALLHHSLTGLLFSHAELWAGLDVMPCSLAFVTHEDGASFGWVGDAQARVRVNGQEITPQWVRVRDDIGREAMAAAFPPGVPVEVDLAWGSDAAGVPLVNLAADWGAPHPVESTTPAVEAPMSPFVAPVAPPAAEPIVAAPIDEPIVAAPMPALELPSDLPQDQPSLHAPIADEAPAPAATIDASAPVTGDAPRMDAPHANAVDETPHPVQRWLNRMVNWGGKPATPAVPGEVPAPPAMEPAPPAPAPHVPTVAEAPAPGRPPVWRPDDALASPASAPPRTTHTPAAPVMPPAITNEAPAPTEPEPEAPAPAPEAVVEKTREPRPDLSQALPMLRTKLLEGTPLAFEITHEPVGAASEGFAIPPLPERAQSSATDATRSEGPPPLPATSDVSEAATGEGTMVIETHVGADREPVRREIASQVRSAPREAQAPLPGPPSLAGTFGPPAPHPAQPPRNPHDSALASAAPESVVQPLAVPAPQVAEPDVAWAQDPAAVAAGRPRRAWPLPDAAETAGVRGSLVKRFAPWAGLLVVLMAAGWWLGHADTGGTPRWLRAVGFGGATFEVVVNSHPPGAFISVDGKEIGQRTPATLDLKPGDHEVKLSMPDLGAAVFPVKGARGDRTTLDLPLSGSLDVVSADASLPLNVALDGKPMGFAPVRVDSIAPGLHEVTFSGPGMPAWVQSVQVGIHQNAQVLARPVTSPGTGVLQVQAVLNDETGSSPLTGAQVYVDGDLKGTTPATLEVSRGPHSLKVMWHGVSAPVQVIDLPGGNQRFATFNFGLDEDAPSLSLIGGARSVSASQTSVVSAELDGMRPTELREGWLHVRSAEGVWRRYPLTLLPSPNGVAMVGVFPSGAFDADGRTRWYMSASTMQGDEYFTEIQGAYASGGASAAKPKAKPNPAPTEQP